MVKWRICMIQINTFEVVLMFRCCEVLLVLKLYNAQYINWNWCLCSKFIDSFEGENNKKENVSSFKLSLMRSYDIQRIPFHSSGWHFLTNSSMFAWTSPIGDARMKQYGIYRIKCSKWDLQLTGGWNHHIILLVLVQLQLIRLLNEW
jgi:hypothetical protein